SIPKNPMGQYTATPIPDYRNEFSLVKYSLNYTLNKKFNAKNNLTSGFILDLYDFHLVDSILMHGKNFVTLRNFTGNSLLAQAYTNWQHRISERFTLNTGLHFQYFAFNKTTALEPRLGVK